MSLMYVIDGPKGTEVHFGMSYEAWRTVLYHLERKGRYNAIESVDNEVTNFVNAVRAEMQHISQSPVSPVSTNQDLA